MRHMSQVEFVLRKKNERVIGLHKCVQTVMARGTYFFFIILFCIIVDILYVCKIIWKGLVSDWKQPIFYDFDTKVTKELLYYIIEKLYSIGFNVLSMVSDMGSSNVGLWKSLDVSTEKTSFEHPITRNNVYVFADPPHLLKLARNHLLDKWVVHTSFFIV